MGRFFSHVRRGEEQVRDSLRTDLDGAKSEATEATREILIEALKFGAELGVCVIEIIGEQGETLAKVPLTDIIDQAYLGGYPSNRRYSRSGTP